MRRLIIIAFAIFAFSLSGCSKDNNSKTEANYNPNPRVGAQATDFQFRDIDEKPFRLSGKKGSVVILYFWRMKCEECKESMTSLAGLSRKYKDKGLFVVTVGADTMHSAPINDVREFLGKFGDAFLNIRDDEGFVSEAYDVLRAPEAFIIDKKGVLVSVQNGKTDFLNPDNIKLIESLLN